MKVLKMILFYFFFSFKIFMDTCALDRFNKVLTEKF